MLSRWPFTCETRHATAAFVAVSQVDLVEVEQERSWRVEPAEPKGTVSTPASDYRRWPVKG